jgi:glucosamine-6-phosphate deaminase
VLENHKPVSVLEFFYHSSRGVSALQVRIFDDQETAAVYAAAVVEQVIRSKPHCVLGLATGSTPIPLYRQLVQFHRYGLSFAGVATINLDEYVGLPPDHKQSYHYYMHEHLFRHVDIPEQQIHLLRGDAPDLEAECKRFDEVIRNHTIDLQILGIGVNGHIGFNEPDSALKANTHVVQLAPETIAANSRFFGPGESVPTQAITVGLQAILRAKQVMLLAFGREKAQIVYEALTGDVRTSLPASLLQVHPHVTFVLDSGAAEVLLERGWKPNLSRT